MLKRRTVAVLVLALIFLPKGALADTVTGSALAGWQSWTAADLDRDSKPYWDHRSWDGGNKNVGYCLTGTGSCGMSSPPGALPFWGYTYNSATDSGGTADPNISFSRTSSASSAALLLELAGNRNYNVFGWYDTANTAVLHTIFSGIDGAGVTTFFSPSASYGFFLTGRSGETWYMNAGLNPTGQTGDQHFAVFRGTSENYWVGVEDLPFSNSDKDYNDMIVRVAPVPEPGSLVLFGTGVLGLAGMVRKKLKS